MNPNWTMLTSLEHSVELSIGAWRFVSIEITKIFFSTSITKMRLLYLLLKMQGKLY